MYTHKNEMDSKKCHNVFTVDPKAHRLLRSLVDDTREHGGNFSVNYCKGTLEIESDDKSRSRDFTEVKIKRSIVDFHTHPSKCIKDVCAVSTPSPADLLNVAAGIMHGNFCHFVYTKDGVFRIQLAPGLDRHLMNSSFRHQFVSSVNSSLNKLYAELDSGKMSYRAYKTKYLDAAKQLGFHITLFPNSVRPSVKIDFDCDKQHHKVREVSYLDIPPDIAQQFRHEP